MRSFRCLFISILILSSATDLVGQPLQTGDLVFLDLDCGNLCDAIEEATIKQFDVEGPRLSHVGVVERDGSTGKIWVYEAWPVGGVVKTSWADFKGRVKGGLNQPGGYYVGRLRFDYRHAGEVALERMKTKLGSGYDEQFSLDDEKFYCSELVQYGWQNIIVDDKSTFETQPMFFGAPKSDERLAWNQYYNKWWMNAPEGKLGISPLGIYLRGKQILFQKDF